MEYKMDKSPWISPKTGNKLYYGTNSLAAHNEEFKNLGNNIFDLRYPEELHAEDQLAHDFYEGRAFDYEKFLHLTFETYGVDEDTTRSDMVNRLMLKSDSKVLEIASGTGRDTSIINNRLDDGGEIHITDISFDMMKACYNKLNKKSDNSPKQFFSLVNAMKLPFEDNYFDALYSFGAVGEFSDPKKFFEEAIRVCKPGSKIVVGDENLPVWLRDCEFGQILANYNKQFLTPIPFESLPVEARNVKCEWVIGGVFYLLEFEVGLGEPYANFDFEIPGIRGGTHKTRMFGQLEGVTLEVRQLAWEAQQKTGISMHKWLNNIVKRESLKVLGKEK